MRQDQLAVHMVSLMDRQLKEAGLDLRLRVSVVAVSNTRVQCFLFVFLQLSYDRVCSGWSAVEQGLRQGCALAPLLFNIFFAAVINVASTRIKGDKGIMDALVHLRKKRGAGGGGGSICRRVCPRDAALGHALR